ncbi:MAG: hypothetical protein ACREOM_00910 [Candidatus Dormibacteraceae bacterium]
MAVISMALVLYACGSEVGSLSTPSPSGSMLASAARIASIRNCPATVTNTAGVYSFECPTGWTFINCEDYSYTSLVNPGARCGNEVNGARMIVTSSLGDQSAGPENNQGIYVGQRQSSQMVTVAGITGTRRTYLVVASNPLPPPRGTAQVVYTFVTGGRTYFAFYNRFPGDTDLTTAFDQMVKGSLKFAA